MSFCRTIIIFVYAKSVPKTVPGTRKSPLAARKYVLVKNIYVLMFTRVR